MRKVLLGISCLLSWSLIAQNLHLDQSLYLSGDTIQGVAYFEEEALVPYAYHLSLFDDKGEATFNKLIWAPTTGVEFFLPLSSEVSTGKYTLQLSNYQNGMVTHAQEVWIIGGEESGALDLTGNVNQIGWVIKQANALNINLFEQADTTKYTVQVLEDGIGEKPLKLNAGESAAVETRPNSKVQINVRDDKYRIFGVPQKFSERGVTLQTEQRDDSMDLSLTFDEPMTQVSIAVTDLSQNPGKNAYPIFPNDVKPNCKDIPNHARLNVGLKTWLRGFQLAGTLTNSENGSKIDGQRLVLANPQDEFDLKYTATNDEGRFGFYNLDFEGEKTLFLSPTGSDLNPGAFEYSPPRSYLVSQFPVCPSLYATTSGELNEMVRLRLLNRKVLDQFLEIREVPVRKRIYTPKTLFEDANNTIVFSDYVEFATMKEVIKEIIPYVFLTKKGIGVFSVDQKKSFVLKPLILINGVPIPYEEIIMELQPSEIHSVQVLNKLSTIAPYGNLALGGIVSIVMKDRFDFPDILERIEVEGYFQSPAPVSQVKHEGIPYFPSVLHWESSLSIDQDGSSSVALMLPDYETRLGIEIMGLTDSGNVIRKYEVINLSKDPK